jgi:vacuolar-type H+-ATPase subunit I/STV1
MAKQYEEASGWVGWIGFAATMLALIGILHMMAGFVALFQNDVYTVTPNAVWVLDYSQWGWTHIIGGLLAFLAAGSLVQGHMYGRVIAVLVALVSIVANMAFVPVYPFWSIMMVVIGVLVIWAVMVHGKEMQVE